jgi:hypothetical protein
LQLEEMGLQLLQQNELIVEEEEKVPVLKVEGDSLPSKMVSAFVHWIQRATQ